ncbi:hypothetical protein HGRIS_005966 [Hohenbuehelia grisea]|uniref:3-beta hydroxysteroid dehydrogenase/isomerase domain-containing protein n=1 Tax=Hohenbuehelia grisea TaxID=104357 RepID=A0ABR3JZC4_9AGAR
MAAIFMGATKDVYLVIGGSGFLGRHIVQCLLDRGDTVSAFDVVQRYHDVPFYDGDLTQYDSLLTALKKSGATCIIHTASPHARGASTGLFWKVNVKGTNTIIQAAIDAGVRKLVYTSSSGVVFNGSPVNGINETYPICDKHMDVYMETKAKAEEAVLKANGKRGLLTVALRPSGIFGPGDRQVMVGMFRLYEGNRTHVQIGDNSNRCDWTYVTNVAHAHVLAADKLGSEPSLPVAGEVFFITNDDPWFFWDFANAIWDRLDGLYPGKRQKRKPTVIPRQVGFMLAWFAEWFSWITGRPPTFTRFNMTFSCTPRWHSIEKAKKNLGYRPQVSMDEGLELLLDWWKKEHVEAPQTQTST